MTRLGKSVPIEKINAVSRMAIKDTIPVELVLTIILNKQPVASISCLPCNLIELAIGYLLNNSYIKNYSDIILLRLCEKELDLKTIPTMSIWVETKPDAETRLEKGEGRLTYVPPGCGSFNDIILQKEQEIGKIKVKSHVAGSTILKLNLKNLSSQSAKKEFGGLHSSALFDCDCNCICIMEDIGRHNCIDKLAGHIATRNIDPSGKIVFTTGRLSIDIIFKIYMMKVPVIVSNSSITHSAAMLAKKICIISIGYFRGGKFNIYSNPSRIKT